MASHFPMVSYLPLREPPMLDVPKWHYNDRYITLHIRVLSWLPHCRFRFHIPMNILWELARHGPRQPLRHLPLSHSTIKIGTYNLSSPPRPTPQPLQDLLSPTNSLPGSQVSYAFWGNFRITCRNVEARAICNDN